MIGFSTRFKKRALKEGLRLGKAMTMAVQM